VLGDVTGARPVWFSHPSHPLLARRHRQASATLAARHVWSCATFTFADRPWESLFGVTICTSPVRQWTHTAVTAS